MVASGTIGFSLKTFDTSLDVTITGSVSGILTSDSESDIARKILDQTKIIIDQNGATYDSSPESINVGPSAQFQLTRTDHCICFWSQAQFSLEITSNTAGTFILISSCPGLITVNDFVRYGVSINQDYSDHTTEELATHIELLSDDIVSTLRNNIVLSTYVIDNWCNMTDAIKLPVHPVVKMDSPVVKMPFVVYSLISSDAFLDVTDRYIVQSDGWVNYRNTQTLLMDGNNPFNIHNQWKVTWVAGYFQIPNAIKLAMARLAPLYTSYSAYEELAGGTSRAKFKDEEKERKTIFRSLTGYML